MSGLSNNSYDVIIIGAGLGGLAAAATQAQAGRKVLLVEKEPHVGGYFGPLEYNSCYFNNGPRLLMGCNADGPHGPGVTYALLERLGVAGQVAFIPVNPFTTVRMPGLELQLWTGREAFIAGLNAAHPGGYERLPELLELCSRMHLAGISYYTAKTPWELARIAGPLAEVLRYQNATQESVLAHYIPQARPRSLVGTLWPYLGLSPRQGSFIYWAILMATYIDEGAYFCKGGLHQVSQAVANAFLRDGGELQTGTAVTRLLVQDRQVRGVELAGGEQFFARRVIANLDPRQVFGELLAPEQRPLAYLRKLNQMKLSIQSVNLSLVTDLDLPALGFGYETMFIDGWDEDQLWQDLLAGQPGVLSLTRLDAADPGLAAPGQHVVNLLCGLPPDFDNSPANVQRLVDALLVKVEQYAPGLMDHLVLANTGEGENIGPGYRTSFYGPIYGWSSLPRYTALRRLGPVTPVRGLTLAGQWTRPGQGAMGVVLSGIDAANRLLR